MEINIFMREKSRVLSHVVASRIQESCESVGEGKIKGLWTKVRAVIDSEIERKSNIERNENDTIYRWGGRFLVGLDRYGHSWRKRELLRNCWRKQNSRTVCPRRTRKWQMQRILNLTAASSGDRIPDKRQSNGCETVGYCSTFSRFRFVEPIRQTKPRMGRKWTSSGCRASLLSAEKSYESLVISQRKFLHPFSLRQHVLCALCEATHEPLREKERGCRRSAMTSKL